jgi:hypothetical protein
LLFISLVPLMITVTVAGASYVVWCYWMWRVRSRMRHLAGSAAGPRD